MELARHEETGRSQGLLAFPVSPFLGLMPLVSDRSGGTSEQGDSGEEDEID